jgi:excisionase family DNA binding protein
MSKSTGHDSLKSDPVSLFDNSSSSPRPVSELMTVAEAAAFLRISESGVRRLQHGRQVPFIKVGHSVRFAKRDLVLYLTKRRVEPLAQ